MDLGRKFSQLSQQLTDELRQHGCVSDMPRFVEALAKVLHELDAIDECFHVSRTLWHMDRPVLALLLQRIRVMCVRARSDTMS